MLTDYLPFLVIGLTIGSVYGIAAMGLVLTYKTAGLFNIGHGAVAALGAYLFYSLHQEHGLPWPIALSLTVLGYGLVTGLMMERLAAALAGVPTFYRIIATVGLLVGIRGLLVLIYGPISLQFRPFLPSKAAFEISGVQISYENLIAAVLGAATAAGLYWVFRRTRVGVSMRAVVDDPQLLDMTGESPSSVRRRAWVVGCMFASVSGVLFASTTQQLDATLLALLVVQAFGAAAVGAFTSLPLAYVGGLAIGLVQAIIAKEVATHPILQGIDTNIPFIVLFVALLVLPKAKLVEVGRQVKVRVHEPTLSVPARRIAIGASLLAAVVLPQVVGTRLPIWTGGLTQVTLLLSLGLLVRTSGQISLCQVGFAAIGGAAFGHAIQAGLPWGVALVLAGLVTVPVGALIAVPAIRLSGLYLGLATFGFGILLGQYFYVRPFMFGSSPLSTNRPAGFEADKAYFYVVLAVTVLAMAVVALVERSRLGRLLRALADSPLALSTLGTGTNTTRVIVFCLSAFLAGVSGALFAAQFGSITGDAYPFFQSLVLLAVLVVAGRSTISASVIAAIAIYVVPGYVTGDDVQSLLQLGFGVAAIAAAVLSTSTLRERLASSLGDGRRPSLSWDRVRAMQRSDAGHRSPNYAIVRPGAPS